ncbi:YbaY family lipoprotein [uncultured Roseobacter sp.]|uniref:YbaY family lipoprotein n=1 Tax=uncultured Roseobacter sp. TaxID=114847 RepID=UPI002639C45E|nr:YbaY family lipoprotein [uncultured Roseobacter sp.]
MSVQGFVRLPRGSATISGELVVAVEDVSFADAEAQVLTEFSTLISQGDWQISDAGHSFEFEIEVPDDRTSYRRLVLSARVYCGGRNALTTGDALTIDSQPLPENELQTVALDLKIL